MDASLACMVCAVDPQTSSLLLPLAQAAIISAPILLRGHIARGLRRARSGRRGTPEPASPAPPSLGPRHSPTGEHDRD